MTLRAGVLRSVRRHELLDEDRDCRASLTWAAGHRMCRLVLLSSNKSTFIRTVFEGEVTCRRRIRPRLAKLDAARVEEESTYWAVAARDEDFESPRAAFFLGGEIAAALVDDAQNRVLQSHRRGVTSLVVALSHEALHEGGSFGGVVGGVCHRPSASDDASTVNPPRAYA